VVKLWILESTHSDPIPSCDYKISSSFAAELEFVFFSPFPIFWGLGLSLAHFNRRYSVLPPHTHTSGQARSAVVYAAAGRKGIR
jgi:hypothetical protein